MSIFTANKLRETREKMGLSQTDVAKMMHITQIPEIPTYVATMKTAEKLHKY